MNDLSLLPFAMMCCFIILLLVSVREKKTPETDSKGRTSEDLDRLIALEREKEKVLKAKLGVALQELRQSIDASLDYAKKAKIESDIQIAESKRLIAEADRLSAQYKRTFD